MRSNRRPRSVARVVQRYHRHTRLANRLLNRIDSDVDRQRGPRQGAGDVRVPHAWQAAEHDRHVLESVGESEQTAESRTTEKLAGNAPDRAITITQRYRPPTSRACGIAWRSCEAEGS